MIVAEVDDAEAIAVGIRKHDEVRVVGIAVPVDSFSSDGVEPRYLGHLLGSAGYVKIQMQAWVVPRWCLAALPCDLGSGTAIWRSEHRRPSAEAISAHLVAEGLAPEGSRPINVPDTQHNHAYAQHRGQSGRQGSAPTTGRGPSTDGSTNPTRAVQLALPGSPNLCSIAGSRATPARATAAAPVADGAHRYVRPDRGLPKRPYPYWSALGCSRAYRPLASGAHRGTVRGHWRFRVRPIALFGRLTTQGVKRFITTA